MNPCPCWTYRDGSTAAGYWSMIYSLVFIGLLGWQLSVISLCQDNFVQGVSDSCSRLPAVCPCDSSLSGDTYEALLSGAFVVQVSVIVLLCVLLISNALLFVSLFKNNVRMDAWPYSDNEITKDVYQAKRIAEICPLFDMNKDIMRMMHIIKTSRLWLLPYICTMPIQIVVMVAYCIVWWIGGAKIVFITIAAIMFLCQPVNFICFLEVLLFYKSLKNDEPRKVKSRVYEGLQPCDDGSGYTKSMKGFQQHPGVIVYKRSGEKEPLMFARAQVFDEGGPSDDSGYRSSPSDDCRPVQKTANQPRQDLPSKPGQEPDAEGSSDSCGRELDRKPLLPEPSTTKDDAGLSTRAHHGSTNETGECMSLCSSDEDSTNESMVTHGHVSRKDKHNMGRGVHSRRSYRKGAIPRSHSESELQHGRTKSPHHRRIENRHRRSKHFDETRQVCCRNSRSRSRSQNSLREASRQQEDKYFQDSSIKKRAHSVQQNTTNLKIDSEITLKFVPQAQLRKTAQRAPPEGTIV